MRTKTCSLDLTPLNNRFPTGISRYTERITDSLDQLSSRDLLWLTSGFHKPVFRNSNATHIAYEYTTHDLTKYQRDLSALLTIERPHAHFSPYYPLPDKFRRPTFLTIFDLLPLKNPEWFPGTRSKEFFEGPIRESAQRATGIFAISQATKVDIQELYGIPGDKIIVTPLAPVISNPALGSSPNNPPAQPFFLCIGTLEPRKNFGRILDAFKLLIGRRPELPHRLVVVGAYGWKSDQLANSFEHGGLKDRVTWTGYCSDSELAYYYREADALIFPSLAEGFGLPILEAMASGTPVITSNCSSMPEVGGKAALYCDPHDPESIAFSWESLLDSENGDRRQKLSRDHAKEFNWTKTGEITRDAILATLNS